MTKLSMARAVRALGEDIERRHATLVNAARRHGIAASLTAQKVDAHLFNIELSPADLACTDQGHTGRCWAFAGLNILRRHLHAHFQLDGDFELSQTHFTFYDKLEKARFALRCAADWEREHAAWGERGVDRVLDQCTSDGGNWSMFVNIVERYGVLPKQLMPETHDARDTYDMNNALRKIVTAAFFRVRACAEPRDRHAVSSAALADVLRLLVASLGNPPLDGTWTLRARDGDATAVRDVALSARELYAACAPVGVRERVTLCHFPSYVEPGRAYRVRLSCNMVGAPDAAYTGTTADGMARACLASLRAGRPVWIGVDSTEDDRLLSRALDLSLVSALLPLSKEEAVRSRDALPVHAMVLVDVHVDEAGTPVRWKVENSHGPDGPNKGYLTMTHAWFERYVYTAAVAAVAADATDAERATGGDAPIVLPPWSPLGNLTRRAPAPPALTRAR